MEPSAAVVEKGTQFLTDIIWNRLNEVARRHKLPDPISRESVSECIELKARGKGDFRYVKLQAPPYTLRVLESPSGDQLMATYDMLGHFNHRVMQSGFLDREDKLYYILTFEKLWMPESENDN